MEKFKQRLIDFARARYDMGQTRFEDYCGLAHGTISAIKAVGIDGRVDVTLNTGTRRKTEIKHKYELVSSHTARRTGITLLYMTGVPLHQVMLISGHKDEDSIRHYLRLTKEENVAMLRDNPFFK